MTIGPRRYGAPSPIPTGMYHPERGLEASLLNRALVGSYNYAQEAGRFAAARSRPLARGIFTPLSTSAQVNFWSSAIYVPAEATKIVAGLTFGALPGPAGNLDAFIEYDGATSSASTREVDPESPDRPGGIAITTGAAGLWFHRAEMAIAPSSGVQHTVRVYAQRPVGDPLTSITVETCVIRLEFT